MSYEEEVGHLRENINNLNNQIIKKILERKEIAVKIGQIKRRFGRPIKDEARENIVYHQVRGLAKKHGLAPDKVERIFKEIISLSIDAEEKI